MRVQCKTTVQLMRDGFKTAWDCGSWYRGNKKDYVDGIRASQVQQLAGKIVEVVEVDCASRGIVKVSHGGHLYKDVPVFFFTTKLDFSKIKTPPSFGKGSSKATYLLGKFNFPCSFDELNRFRARELAKWVLKVSA